MSETPMKISIDLVMVADDALKKTDTMNQYVETMNQRLEQMAAAAKAAGFEIGDLTASFKMTEKVTAMSAARLLIAFGGIIALANNAFNSMASWSPSLAAQLGLAKLNMGLLAMEMGEHLAPIIENIVVPATQFLLDTVKNLSPQVKQLISVFIALIPLAATLGVGFLFLKSGVLGFLAPILLAIAFFAVFVVFINTIIEAVKKTNDPFEKARIIMLGIAGAIALAALAMLAFNISISPVLIVILAIVAAIALAIAGLLALRNALRKKYDKPDIGVEGDQGGSKKTVDQILADQADEYHSGGVFAGDRPGLAMLKPRERVLTPTEQRSLGLLGGGGSGTTATVNNTYNITIQGGSYSSPAARRMEAEKFAKQLETQSNARGFV